MKIWPYTFLFVFLAASALPRISMAQDAGMSDVDIVDARDHADNERILYGPGEAEIRYIPKVSTRIRDSVALRGEMQASKRKVEPVVKPGEKQPAKNEDDSILTFNFLYYIIQKYKLQDIIN